MRYIIVSCQQFTLTIRVEKSPLPGWSLLRLTNHQRFFFPGGGIGVLVTGDWWLVSGPGGEIGERGVDHPGGSVGRILYECRPPRFTATLVNQHFQGGKHWWVFTSILHSSWWVLVLVSNSNPITTKKNPSGGYSPLTIFTHQSQPPPSLLKKKVPSGTLTTFLRGYSPITRHWNGRGGGISLPCPAINRVSKKNWKKYVRFSIKS